MDFENLKINVYKYRDSWVGRHSLGLDDTGSWSQGIDKHAHNPKNE